MNKFNNNIVVNWRQLFGTIEGIESGKDNNIIIEREIIPIIFVPGIMGSKLKQTEPSVNWYGAKKIVKAWDPDSIWHNLTVHIDKTPSNHQLKVIKDLLIGEGEHDPDFLSVLNEESYNGFHNIFSSYEGIKEALRNFSNTDHELDEYNFFKRQYKHSKRWVRKGLAFTKSNAIDHCFEYPVYGFGYNWTASNARSGKKLKTYIESIIDRYTKEKRECNQVILVTHSMGGLVAREACRLLSLEGEDSKKVLCVIHGAQPVHGAVAAYSQMKLGTKSTLATAPGIIPEESSDHFINKMKARALGVNGKAVTVKMARMPGALELLPTKAYKTNDHQSDWLQYYDNNTEKMLATFPKSDPYKEIYEEKNALFRLVNPEWLEPWIQTNSNKRKNDRSVIDDDEHESVWGEYLRNVREAKNFHEALGDYKHPSTYQFYGVDLATAERVRYTHEINRKHLFKPQGKLMAFGDIDRYMQRRIYFTVHQDTGDGTVLKSSAKGLKKTLETARASQVELKSWNAMEHQAIYDPASIQGYVINVITRECNAKIRKTCNLPETAKPST